MITTELHPAKKDFVMVTTVSISVCIFIGLTVFLLSCYFCQCTRRKEHRDIKVEYFKGKAEVMTKEAQP